MDQIQNNGEQSQWLVSFVANGYTHETQHFPPSTFVDWIKGGAPELERRIKRIRQMLAEGDTPTAKRAKVKLPAVTWSGTFRQKSKPMLEQLIEHSGLLCADLDDLGEYLPKVRNALTKSPHVWAIFVSPSGNGLKCVFRVAADAAKHYASFLAVQKFCKDVHGIDIDAKCSDIGRLCFLSRDPDVYFNKKAIELAPIQGQAKEPEPVVLSDRETARRREIAETVIEGIEWEDDTTGYTECPGESSHSSPTGNFRVKIDDKPCPSFSCFHTSCKHVVDTFNYKLRSLIAKKIPQQKMELIQLSTVEMKPIVFVDKPLFQAHAFHLLVGKKNAGKGTFLSAKAAQFTRGEFGENRNVLWIAAGEDSLALDVRPRIEAAGGDASCIYCPTDVPRLPEAEVQLRAWINKVGRVGLVILDPISGLMPGKDSNQDSEVRPAISPLNELADQARCVVVGVRHLKKDLSQGALAGVLGTVDWVNVPRAVLGIVQDDEDAAVRHVQVLTGNRVPTGTASLSFRIVGSNIVAGGEPVAKAEFIDGPGKDVEEILSVDRRTQNTQLSQAQMAILDVLEKENEGVEADTLSELRFSATTIRRAKAVLKEEGLIEFERLSDSEGRATCWMVRRSGLKRPVALGGKKDTGGRVVVSFKQVAA